MIDVLYIATDSYTEYKDEFFGSFKYFAPGREKRITVLTNKPEEFDGIELEDGTPIKVIKMLDLLYPCINLHKSYFIEQLNFDGDYIFYFDADTKFKSVLNYAWNALFDAMDNGEVIISKHPVYSLKDGAHLYNWEKQKWINNFCSANMTEKDPSRQSYIAKDVYTYVISSFFAASNKTMHTLNELIVKMTRNDLTRSLGYHIPSFMDENYFNALVSDYEDGITNCGLKFSVKQYSQLYGKDEETNYYSECFLYQKNFKDYKHNRR